MICFVATILTKKSVSKVCFNEVTRELVADISVSNFSCLNADIIRIHVHCALDYKSAYGDLYEKCQ